MSAMSMAVPPRQFDFSRMFRPHLLAIPRYVTSTSDEKQDRAAITLDANENSAGSSLQDKDEFGEAGTLFGIDDLHRYPSASQRELKERVVQWRSLQSTDQICVGSGASDLVDLLIRATCVPGSDKILVTPPTFELYRVCAELHDVGVVANLQQLTAKGMHVSAEDLCKQLASDAAIKVVFLASPGNPTGSLVALNTIQRILDEPTFGGLVVVDEAYIDFADAPDQASALTLLSRYRNLVVIQSLSKSHGLAGLRVGVALAHPTIIEILHKIQMPFKIGSMALQLASKALDPAHRTRQQQRIASVREERTRLLAAIRRPCWASSLQPLLGQNDPAANFVTIMILAPETGRPDDHRARTLVVALKSRFAISVRYVGMQPLCTGCVRITVGTSTEVDLLTAALHELLLEQHGPP